MFFWGFFYLRCVIENRYLFGQFVDGVDWEHSRDDQWRHLQDPAHGLHGVRVHVVAVGHQVVVDPGQDGDHQPGAGGTAGRAHFLSLE